MAMRSDISAETVRQLLAYDPETGVLTWKPRTPDMFSRNGRSQEWKCRNWNSRHAGKRAGCVDKSQYTKIRFYGGLFYAHRLAWVIVHGVWPEANLDHKHGVNSGDRLSNLRPATQAENMQNRCASKRNSSGYLGVSWSISSKKWTARIRANGKYLHLGLFATAEEAAEAYLSAKRKFHAFQPEPRNDPG